MGETSFKQTLKFEQEWVQILINLRMKYSKLFTGRRNSATEGWKLIFDDLQQFGAPEHLTINKIKKKWMNLMTRYKQIKNNQANLNQITWPFFEQIDRAFGKNYNNSKTINHKEKRKIKQEVVEEEDITENNNLSVLQLLSDMKRQNDKQFCDILSALAKIQEKLD